MTYLFYNWKFVPFDSLHPFHTPPTIPLATTNLLSASMSVHLPQGPFSGAYSKEEVTDGQILPHSLV